MAGCRAVVLVMALLVAPMMQAADPSATRPAYQLIAPSAELPLGFSADARYVYSTPGGVTRETDLVTGVQTTLTTPPAPFGAPASARVVSRVSGLSLVSATFNGNVASGLVDASGAFVPIAPNPYLTPDGFFVAGASVAQALAAGAANDPDGRRFPLYMSNRAFVPAGADFFSFLAILDATTVPARLRICGARATNTNPTFVVGYDVATNALVVRDPRAGGGVGTLACDTDDLGRQPTIANFRQDFPIGTPANEVYSRASDDGRVAVTAGGYIVDRQTRSILFTPQALGATDGVSVTAVGMSRDGRYVLVGKGRPGGTGASDFTVSVVDLGTRRVAAFVLNRQQQPLAAFLGSDFIMSNDGSRILFNGGGVDFITVPGNALTATLVACNPFLCDALPDTARAEAPVATKSVISDDGRYAFFDSAQSTLVGGDTNAAADVFRIDRATGVTTAVDRDASGALLAGGGRGPSINSDGTQVAFDAPITNAANAPTDVVVRDLVGGLLLRMSQLLGIDVTQTPLYDAALSGNGKFAAVVTVGPLVPADTDGAADVYRVDLATGAVVLASGGVAGACARPALSRDGEIVAFDCTPSAAAKGANDTQTYLYDRLQQKLELVSRGTTAAGEIANAASRLLGLSADGNSALIVSGATNISAGDTNALPDLFLYRRDALGTLTRLSTSSAGGGIDGPVTGGALSGDGQAFAFSSTATNIDPLGTNGNQALYLGAVTGGPIRQVRRGLEGPVTANSTQVALSYTGSDVLFANDGAPGGKGAVVAANLLVANNPSVGTDALTVSSQFAGLWYNLAQNGHGFLVELTESNGVPTVIVSWYVYLNGSQRWLFGSAPLGAGGASVPMFITRGTSFPPAFDPARVVLEPWGVLTLKFLAPNQGIFAWTTAYPGFGPGALRVDRLSSVSERAADRAGEMPSCASGTWFDVARPGQGFQVQKLAGDPAQLVVIWYVYDQGQQFWLIGQGPVVGNQATVAMVSTRGGTFPPIFNPAAVQQSPWGNLTFRFVDANRARVDWAPTAPGFTSGGYDLARLSVLAARPCR